MDSSLPINDRWLYRVLLPLAGKIHEWYTRSLQPSVFDLTPKFVLKYGPHILLSEAHAIDFVSKKTNIPVPQVITAFEKNGYRYILMTRCQGDCLSDIYETLSTEDLDEVGCQLRAHIGELRRCQPPKPGIASVNYSVITRKCQPLIGPFGTVEEFHQALLPNPKDLTEREKEQREEIIKAQESRQYTTVLTHGDLAFQNLMWHDGKISIIDWETAGWLPDYWEYVSSWTSPSDRLGVWKWLEEFPRERDVEIDRRGLVRGIEIRISHKGAPSCGSRN